ncbi:c-type cytochrome [Salipiger sp. H15]|uniref:C-type cytochrome n=1 Tax=Alloyangia sp. H15 TaxID=3029062 RepID=A0AAU8AMZ5_9RHOB
MTLRAARLALILAASLAPLAAAPVAAMDGFVLEDEVAVCAGCHGEAGVPAEADYPVIWGQQYFYILTQLRDYAAGRRQNEIMSGIAAEYDRDQAKQLAEHFAAQTWPALPADPADGDRALAEKAFTVAQCSACHGKWQGDSRIPRLAGQQVGYLSRTMHEFKDEVRNNAPDMSNVMKQFDEATITAMSSYLSSLVLH